MRAFRTGVVNLRRICRQIFFLSIYNRFPTVPRPGLVINKRSLGTPCRRAAQPRDRTAVFVCVFVALAAAVCDAVGSDWMRLMGNGDGVAGRGGPELRRLLVKPDTPAWPGRDGSLGGVRSALLKGPLEGPTNPFARPRHATPPHASPAASSALRSNQKLTPVCGTGDEGERGLPSKEEGGGGGWVQQV